MAYLQDGTEIYLTEDHSPPLWAECKLVHPSIPRAARPAGHGSRPGHAQPSDDSLSWRWVWDAAAMLTDEVAHWVPIRDELVARIDTACGPLAGRITSQWPAQQSIYQIKAQEARGYVDAQARHEAAPSSAPAPVPADYPLLVKEAARLDAINGFGEGAPAATLADAAASILAAAQNWTMLASALDDARLRNGKDRVRALFAGVSGSTPEEYEASAQAALAAAEDVVRAVDAALVQIAAMAG